MNLIARMARLPASDRRLIVRAAFSLIIARAALMLFGLPRLRRALDRRARLEAISATRPELSKIAWAIAAANRPFRYECLPIALAARSMLLHYGYPAELKLGAGRDAAGAFIAHAWVESEGRIVVGGFEPGAYVELARDGDSAATALAGRF